MEAWGFNPGRLSWGDTWPHSCPHRKTHGIISLTWCFLVGPRQALGCACCPWLPVLGACGGDPRVAPLHLGLGDFIIDPELCCLGVSWNCDVCVYCFLWGSICVTNKHRTTVCEMWMKFSRWSILMFSFSDEEIKPQEVKWLPSSWDGCLDPWLSFPFLGMACGMGDTWLRFHPELSGNSFLLQSPH